MKKKRNERQKIAAVRRLFYLALIVVVALAAFLGGRIRANREMFDRGKRAVEEDISLAPRDDAYPDFDEDYEADEPVEEPFESDGSFE
ncbi:MAG: hypothetical protein IJM30_12480 [Thermoguttaceae bacterium]|nr:hypothetical protein [Thermoguttaceae bacterium]